MGNLSISKLIIPPQSFPRQKVEGIKITQNRWMNEETVVYVYVYVHICSGMLFDLDGQKI